jgi:arsenite-transporting ATPase
LLFAGKGGVGKTTLACATAIRLARQQPGRQVLLLSADPAHSLSDCLTLPVGPQETRIGPGLTAIELDAEAEFEQLRQQYIDEVASFFGSLAGQGTLDLAFDREVIERMIDFSPPGLDELMALTRAMSFLEAGPYELLVIDTPPTGHLMRLLELPELIQEWLKVFFDLLLKYRKLLRLPRIADFMVDMSKKTKSLRALLADPKRSQLYAVSILTEMSFEETRSLLATCKRTGIGVPVLFLNLATPPSDCPLCRAVARAEAAVRHSFAEAFPDVHQPVVYRCSEPRGPDRLAELGQELYAQ